MSYATKADMLLRYGDTELRQLSDINTPRLGVVADAVVQRALDDATAWIDGHLIGRYPLPIGDPAALRKLNLDCAAEARFLLMTTHVDDAAQKAHDERMLFYRAVAKGDIALIAAVDAPAAIGIGPVLFDRGSKVFGRETTLADELDTNGRSGW